MPPRNPYLLPGCMTRPALVRQPALSVDLIAAAGKERGIDAKVCAHQFAPHSTGMLRMFDVVRRGHLPTALTVLHVLQSLGLKLGCAGIAGIIGATAIFPLGKQELVVSRRWLGSPPCSADKGCYRHDQDAPAESGRRGGR